MSNEINLINNYKRSLITLLTITLILIGCIYISYGEFFDNFFTTLNNPLKIYQLHTHLSILSGDLSPVSLSSLPQITASIGYYSVAFIYILFSGWLLLFATSSYLKLFQRVGSKIIILFELFILLAIYIISISPELNLWLSIIGYLIIAIVFVMLSLYWVYEFKSKQ